MEKSNKIKKENHSIFFNFIKKREDLDESSFIGSIDDLQKDLSSFWEKMQN